MEGLSDHFDIPWDVVKNIEKSQLAKDYAKIFVKAQFCRYVSGMEI